MRRILKWCVTAVLGLWVGTDLTLVHAQSNPAHRPITERWLKSDLATGGSHQWQNVSAARGAPVRYGQKSQRFELRAGECGRNKNWSDCQNARARVEALPPDNRSGRLPKVGEVWWYGWSIFLPADFPAISPARITAGQWKMPTSRSGVTTHPPAETFLDTSQYYIRIGEAGKVRQQDVRIARTRDMKGKWTDVVVQAYWAAHTKAAMKVWVNGEYRGGVQGQMLDPQNDRPISFRFGIYLQEMYGRRPTKQPIVMYFDEVAKGRAREAVDVRMREKLGYPAVD